MNINKMKELLNSQGKVKFKLYSLEYIIVKEKESVIIYALLYPNKISRYKNIEELLQKYNVFNENIIDNEDRIIFV